MSQNKKNLWAIVPAAGLGNRMGSEIPKQYLSVNGKSILEYSLQHLLAHPRINKVLVMVAAHDPNWAVIRNKLNSNRILTVSGGGERCQSVYAGLLALSEIALPEDWVLVHDAVRPCLHSQAIQRLIATVEAQGIGGLLALPVRDTIKAADEKGRAAVTMDRTGLWLAQTPQMFRLGELTAAMENAMRLGQIVTDEASAIELCGGKPLLVPGHLENIKITWPEDLAWVKHHLEMVECA